MKDREIETNLSLLLTNFFWCKKCQLFYAPFDVRLYDRKNPF